MTAKLKKTISSAIAMSVPYFDTMIGVVLPGRATSGRPGPSAVVADVMRIPAHVSAVERPKLR